MTRRRTALALTLAAGTLGGGALLVPPATAGSDRSSRPYEVGLLGDMPYGAYGRALYPNVIADINRSRVSFSIFDGDTKNGSEPCYADPHPLSTLPGTTPTPEQAVSTSPYAGVGGYAVGQDVYRYALDLFSRFERPVVYVPGDNEWTDCDRSTLVPPGASDAYDRLAYLRRLSFPTDESLGRRTRTLTRQPGFPENSRWAQGPVTYATLDVTGSDNDWVDDTPAAQQKNGPAAEAQAEYAARGAANLSWLRATFAAAKERGSRGVLLSMQADMWDPAAVQTHFADTKAELVRQVTAFPGPVVLVNGDSHSFEVDKPLTDASTTNAAGRPGPNVVQNFTRVTTFGEYQYHWVSATVDPRDPELFSFHQHTVAADVPTYRLPATG